MIELSVVTPTYNRCESLRATIGGLSRQTYASQSFEHVIVSDGSTDGTRAMVEELAAKSPFHIRLIEQPNGGPSSARNRGIREAVNEVVVFLDDDVEPIPTFLARHASHHEADSRVAVIGPMSPDPALKGREPIWIEWEHVKLREIYDMFNPGGKLENDPPGPMHFYSGNASIRRDHLVAVDGFDEAYTRQEDVELAVRLERDGGVRFVYDREADGIHRPMRTFQSWLNIPASYGRLDAKRLQEGTLQWGDVSYLASIRNPATRLLSDICIAAPGFVPVATTLLRGVAVSLGRAGMTGPAVAALSALYNSVYSQSLRSALDAAGWNPGSSQKTVAKV